jgi:hypothetical protein
MNTDSPMTTLSFDRDLLLSLAADYVHGTCTQADAERLESLLRAEPTARRVFVDYCMLHGQLALSTAAVGPGRREDVAGSVVRTRSGAGRFGLPGMGRVASVLVGLSLAAACLAIIVATPRGVTTPRGNPGMGTGGAGYYDNRQLPVVTVASLRNGASAPQTLKPSTLRPEKSTALVTASGADVNLPRAAVFGVTAGDAGSLYDGSVRARLTTPDANFSVTTSNLRIVDKGTAFSVERIDDDHVHVTVLDGEVEVQSRVRLPLCYWPFDEAGPAAGSHGTDVVGGLTAVLASGATRAAGIVGAGAARFDNTQAAEARIEGGTGDEVGTGRLSMTEGITIEALIVSAWSGGFRDYDEIYRKEDGNSRVLLSLQNDGRNFGSYSEPEVPAGPCLSFGLHLAGRGYRELDMPLDGEDGRPTLAELTDGMPHHVVATYDSFSGRKALFIDGVKRFEHVYPVGTLILSGGPVAATIGNHASNEPFTGLIDEVALYDFALTAEEVAEHHRRAADGENYFGSEVPVADGPRWQAVTRLVEGQSMTFNQRSGLPR